MRAAPDHKRAFLALLDSAQTDWNTMFDPATLDVLAPLMQVFAITTGSVLGIPDAELAANLRLLASRGVRLAFVAQPVITASADCGKTEGYDDVRNLNAAVEKLRRLKLDIAYLALDGGLWFGHYAKGEQECRLSLEQTTAQVAITIRAFTAAYPNIIVGEILPTIPLTDESDWQDSLRYYKDGVEKASGHPLAFLQLDIAWGNPAWRQSVVAETLLGHALGMQVGYIYNGDGEDRTDAVWLAHARDNIAEIEGGLGLVPANASISSWNEHPAHFAGAPADMTLASLLTHYARPATHLALDPASNAKISGLVTDAAGRPLKGASVSLSLLARALGKAGLPRVTISGIVPAEARSAIVGLRINSECLCAGANDVLVGDVAYDEAGGPGRHTVASFMPDLRHFAAVGGNGVPKIRVWQEQGVPIAQVTAAADQSLLLNAPTMTVTPSAPYTLSAALLDLLGTEMFGQVTIIWLDGDGNGLTRDNIPLRPEYLPSRDAVTDTSGRFAFAVMDHDCCRSIRIRAQGAGEFRPAISLGRSPRNDNRTR